MKAQSIFKKIKFQHFLIKNKKKKWGLYMRITKDKGSKCE
jgi:hypothetical protein